MPWFTLIMKNLKLILITLGISALLTSGAWLYFHGKKVANMQLTIQHLESQLETERNVRELLNEITVENQELKNEVAEAQRQATEEIKDAKQNDTDVADYYDQQYPERLRTIRERARCVSMPYLCAPADGEQDSKD